MRQRKTFSNLIFLPYHPIFSHFMDGTFSLFLLIPVAFTGTDLSTISWIHSLSNEMAERLLNEIVLHYTLWPTILPLWCSFITIISFFKSTTFLVLSSPPPPFITFTLIYHHPYHFHSLLFPMLGTFSYFSTLSPLCQGICLAWV